MVQWSVLFSSHIQQLQSCFEEVINQENADGVIIHSGSTINRYLDDQNYEFWLNPRFCQWVPERAMDNSVLVIRPSMKPLLLWHQPVDFWHAVADKPSGFWVNEFDINIVTRIEDIPALLPKGTMIGLGQDEACLQSWGVKTCNPDYLCNLLDWHRGIKTDYEQACIQEANYKAVLGHHAAKQAFLEGDSALDIHLKYLAAVKQKESHMPYDNIIALNENAAVLHYHNYQADIIDAHSFLIDAGASCHHYAADITRTYTKQSCIFSELISCLDREVLAIIEQVKPSVSYIDLNDHMHKRIAAILSEFSIVNVSAESAYEQGYSRVFFPHGLGHLLGLTVHDAGGKLADNKGRLQKEDKRYTALRCLRTLEEGMVLTIEPGLYFISQLLEPHRTNADFNWTRIEQLTPFGGVRIEDNVVVIAEGAFNFTRTAFESA